MMSAALNGFLDFIDGTTVGGWAWDPRTPNDPVVVEISRNGRIIATARADRFREDLRAAGFGNGCHSFQIELPLEATGANVSEPLVFSARIEGSDYELNRSPFRCGPARPESAPPGDAASLEIQRLREEIDTFSRAWKRNDHVANRLASLSARDGGLTRVGARPQWFMIETTSHCNLKCVMCPHGHDAMPNKSHLDTSRFSRSFDFLAVADRMQLFGTGEPLMSEAFWEILESIDPQSQTEVSINSNGTLLNQERIDRLLRSSLSWISISLDAASPETYRRIRGADFDAVIGRVKNLIHERNARRQARSLRIFINMTLMRANIREFPAFVDLAADIGADGVQVNQLLWHQEHCSWEIRKGDWNFVYRDQLLRTSIEEVNECIRRAIERGAARHVPVFFDFSQFEGTTPIVHEELV
jgi:molybdenum cofactor biosynthesis enzyme MoaA